MLGGAVSVMVQPTYTAETELFVATQNSGTLTELQQGNNFSQSRVQSYVRTVTTPIVLQPAIDKLGLDTTANDLASRVKASTDVDTVLIHISVSDSSPVQAAATAQAIATSLISAVEALEKPKSGGESAVTLSIITPATAPDVPSAPNTKINLALGFIAGLVFGVSAAVLKTTLDSRIRGESDLRKVTQAPLLGGIAFDTDAIKKPLLTQTAPQNPRAESYRQLRTNLQFANVSSQARSVLVTSSLPGEGKSTTATNLAIALSQAGQSVCLVDADLRRPMVSEYLGLDGSAGLTTSLVGEIELEELLQPWGDDNLYILSSGRIPPNPSELLGSMQMERLIRRLEETFDSVIIDAPPLLPVTDAAVLAQHVGGVMLVVGTHKVRQHDLEKSFRALDMVSATVLGVVMNRVPSKGPDAYSYGYYSPSDSNRDRARDSTLIKPEQKVAAVSESTPGYVALGKTLTAGDGRAAAPFLGSTTRHD